MKTCTGCGASKPASEFYLVKGKPTAKCKECTKAAVKKYRAGNLDRVRHYDRNRPNAKIRSEESKARNKKKYASDPEFKARLLEQKKSWIQNNKEKRACHIITGNAIKDKRLIRQPCEVCGDTQTDAHHDNYAKPLDVRWLCRVHHAEHHKKERERQRLNSALTVDR